jgi:hypothetical protein
MPAPLLRFRSERPGGTYDTAGNLIERFGFRCFRHTLASFLLGEGNNPGLIQHLLRWSKTSMLDTYRHVMTHKKIATQGSMLERIMPKTHAKQVTGAERVPLPMKSGSSRAVRRAEKPMNTEEKYGRHDWTRTSDLYRVKGARNSLTTTYMATGDCQVPAKTCRTEQSWVGLMGSN